MKPCRVMSVQSLRMHALKAFAPDRANLHSTTLCQALNNLPFEQLPGWGRIVGKDMGLLENQLYS